MICVVIPLRAVIDYRYDLCFTLFVIQLGCGVYSCIHSIVLIIQISPYDCPGVFWGLILILHAWVWIFPSLYGLEQDIHLVSKILLRESDKLPARPEIRLRMIEHLCTFLLPS